LIDPFKKNYFTKEIIEWASMNLRQYPWRNERSPYNIFISEFFLQRTKVKQVLSVYNEFKAEFPDEQSLFNSELQNIKYFFDKLGLIKRFTYFVKIIEFLKKSNKKIDSLTDEEFRSLPGIGQYIFSAFKCFAKNEKVPIVDSNIIRIFIRFFDYKIKMKVIRNDPNIWSFANELLPDINYSEYNYALIDFGALICMHAKPLCKSCILNNECIYSSSLINPL
jgi:A/G-specific adenine glycosylase